MKKLILLYIFILYAESFSQDKIDTTSLVYNLTIGASNPAFGILDLSPSSIERPKDPTNFALLLQNATDNFSIVPNNYSIEISSWVFRPKVSFSKYNNPDIGNSISQTIALSLATTTNKANDSAVEITRLGTGIKFSIVRGKIVNAFTKMSKEYETQLNKLAGINEKNLIENRNKDPEYVSLVQKKELLFESLKEINITLEISEANLSKLEKLPESNDVKIEIAATKSVLDEIKEKRNTVENEAFDLDDKITAREKIIDPVSRKELIDNEDRQEIIKKLEEEAGKILFVRDGFKLDFAGASSFEFRDQFSRMNKLGFWLTGGWDWVNPKATNSTTALGLLKVTFAKDSAKNWMNLYDILHSKVDYDMGVRFIQTWSDFSISFEGVSRNAFSDSTKAKYLFNFGYNAGDNKLIVFSLGKDFDGIPYQKGNLIAALNLLLGLGSKRPFQ